MRRFIRGLFGHKPAAEPPALFSAEDLVVIREAVHKAEENTSGEIRVAILDRIHSEFNGDVHRRAVAEFHALGMQNTRHRTGVLLLIALKERKFAIIGDIGIHAKLSANYWNWRASLLSRRFADGNFTHGVCEAVADVGRELARYFPKESDDTNELPDDVVTEEGK